jgi:hypothetical protein
MLDIINVTIIIITGVVVASTYLFALRWVPRQDRLIVSGLFVTLSMSTFGIFEFVIENGSSVFLIVSCLGVGVIGNALEGFNARYGIFERNRALPTLVGLLFVSFYLRYGTPYGGQYLIILLNARAIESKDE